MTTSDVMVAYQEKLDSWRTSLGKNQETLQSYVGLIDIQYPTWKAKFDAEPEDTTRHDARREYFRNLSVILQNVRLSFIFMRDQLCDRSWWEHFQRRLSGQQVAETLLGYQTMARQYSATQIAAVTEQALTSISCSGYGEFRLTVSQGLDNSCKYVLRRTSLLNDYGELFDVLRLVRNTFHSNGVFSDKAGDIVKEFQGVKFPFQLGQPIGYDNDNMIAMFRWIGEAMWEICTSPAVSAIPYVPVVRDRSTGEVPCQ